MKELIKSIRTIEGVKNVRKQSGPVLKVELFSRELKGSETEEIKGDLRKISRNLREQLENAREEGDIPGWEWIIKPEKKYQGRSLGGNVSDRKSKGHKPAYYRISIE
ncbi:MAG: hypothetical protein H8Z69_00780 [Nanohaloarchaea archaeon]|nr:hypothetical protein [Candidatus Nanohaloarchaea archaeon]